MSGPLFVEIHVYAKIGKEEISTYWILIRIRRRFVTIRQKSAQYRITPIQFLLQLISIYSAVS